MTNDLINNRLEQIELLQSTGHDNPAMSIDTNIPDVTFNNPVIHNSCITLLILSKSPKAMSKLL